MIKNKSSTTALAVTLIRASSKIDSVAHIFLPQPFKFLSHFSFFKNFLEKKMPQNTYQNIINRTKFIDKIIKENNFDQIVILGAGFDSRFIRFYNPKTKFFEIDIKETQQNKISLIKKSKYKINENIFFIPLNLNHGDIKIKLIKKSFNPTKKTLFILEGLTMYLSKLAIDRLFKSIIKISASNNEIVFDFIHQKIVKNKQSEAVKTVSSLGEKWTFGIDNLSSFLQKYHLKLITHEQLSNGEIIPSPKFEQRTIDAVRTYYCSQYSRTLISF